MYCLDTNIVIYYQNGDKKLVSKIISVAESELCISHITRLELFYGAFKSQKVKQNLAFQESFCSQIEIINSSESSDKIFAETKSDLSKKGLLVADLDILIASICLANNLVLVTHNTKHFKNIPGLKVEDWLN